jgi:hypothetical protein
MGLDMYLEARKYIYFDEREKFNPVITRLIPESQPFSIKSITLEVGYWRKANQIHAWFVDNVQDENDDCEEYEVDTEQLIKLKELCEQVLENHDLADTLLPVRSGFFFGGTEYDQDYYEELKRTVEILNKVLLLPQSWSIYYHSSW